MDIMPTFLELAGVEHPNSHPSHPRDMKSFRGRDVYAMRGKSWVPYLVKGASSTNSTGEGDCIHSESDQAVGWELHARAALRKGRWKIVNMPVNAWGEPTSRRHLTYSC